MERSKIIEVTKEIITDTHGIPDGFSKLYRALLAEKPEEIISRFKETKVWNGDTESISGLRKLAKIVIEICNGRPPNEDTIEDEAYKLLDHSYIDHSFAFAMVSIARVGTLSRIEKPTGSQIYAGNLHLQAAAKHLDKSSVYADTLIAGLDLFVQASKKHE